MKPAKKPNVILILADDLGYGDVSCFNPESKVTTVNLDRLAAQGLSFTDMHASSAVSTPSRYGLLTGRYNWRSRLKQGVLPGTATPLIEEGRRTLGTLFRDQGYRTACVGKWHLGMNWKTIEGVSLSDDIWNPISERWDFGIDFTSPIADGPNSRGFDYFYGMTASLDQPPYVMIENDRVVSQPTHSIGTKTDLAKHASPEQAFNYALGPAAEDFDHQKAVPLCDDKVLELIDEYSEGEQPFFLYYPTLAVHSPLVPTKEFSGKSAIGPYGDFILQLDHFVGRLMDKLKEKQLEDDTILIFASDNGCAVCVDVPKLVSMGHNPSCHFRGIKTDIWEGGHRIPCIIRWPGKIPAGVRVGSTACLTDLYATFAELLGYQMDENEGEDSFSLCPLLKGQEAEVRPYTVHHSVRGCYSIRKGHWKLELCAGSGGVSHPQGLRGDTEGMPEFQLYDLSQDIGEQRNQYSNSDQPVVAELMEQLKQCIENGRSTPGTPQENTAAPIWPGLDWINRFH